MKILVAGSTGAVGKPLVDYLIYYGHEVYGITHSVERAASLSASGAKPVHLDVLEKEAVFSAVRGIQPEVVIDMLTSLPKEYTQESMSKAGLFDARLRKEGGSNLQEAAEKSGVRRYIVQSSAFWYEEGETLAHEETPFAFDATPGIAAGTKLYAEIEHRVLQSSKIEGVALRFGFFYGPNTWFNPDGNVADQLRHQDFPIIGSGNGVWNFVHVKDAAIATAAALYCAPGAYNIVNNLPSKMRVWLPAFARYLRAPFPGIISEEEALQLKGPDAVYYATKLRGASNAKAKRELNFQPQSFEWLL